jgi:trans-aconitate methyltransferase
MDMVEVPWPDLGLFTVENVKVPLKEDYAFEDMWYLDTKQAAPIFKTQADIITKYNSKGIVDIGCRHGPVLDYLNHEFDYMGFDTSKEPIDIAAKRWKDYNNIEFRHESWNNKEVFLVDFKVDMVIFSGVLLYREDHFDFFKWVMEFYGAKNAIIQEPYHDQKYWDDRLILNTITKELDQYYTHYNIDPILLDLELFAGRRLILDVTI